VKHPLLEVEYPWTLSTLYLLSAGGEPPPHAKPHTLPDPHATPPGYLLRSPWRTSLDVKPRPKGPTLGSMRTVSRCPLRAARYSLAILPACMDSKVGGGSLAAAAAAAAAAARGSAAAAEGAAAASAGLDSSSAVCGQRPLQLQSSRAAFRFH
jgi:hypothetical protein